MSNLSFWDCAILAIAGYIAITSLVRLMRTRRDEVFTEYQTLVAVEQQRKREQERQQRKQVARAKQLRVAAGEAADES